MQVIFFICALFLVSASAVSAQTPDWASRGLAAVYPSAKYIAEEGRGKTRELAQSDALAAISRYFSAEVSSAVHDLVQETNGVLNESIRVETFVKSNTTLRAVRYAESYYDTRHQEYAVAAYIDREEAWAIYEPSAKKEADAFRALWRHIETESDPLMILLGYKSLQRYVTEEDYLNTISFGEVLNPAKMSALVRDVRENSAKLAAKINETRSMASIFIECTDDHNSIIAGALKRLLSEAGLVVAASKNRASSICAATVSAVYQELPAGHFYTPSVDITISDRKGVPLFSYSRSAIRTGAQTSTDIAKRNAYNALAKKLDENFIEELYSTVE